MENPGTLKDEDCTMTKRKPTLKSIAEMAGVSLAAASMYLNAKTKKYKLANVTCERIEKVMRKNNFIPNFHAYIMRRESVKFMI